jgi:uncharacterized membrane protein YbaN (DUF454 family)
MRVRRGLYAALGVACVAVGAIGVAVPGLPTTVFLVIALWAFTRSSPRLETWLRDHSVLGPFIRDWENERAVPRRAKVLAGVMMAGSVAFAWGLFGIPLWAVVLMSTVLLAAFAYVWTRPEPSRPHP